MLVLGIESASDQCGCALVGEHGVIAEARLALPRRHAEALAPQMRFVCEQAGVALGDVDVVAVDNGPGLYTGLRAGLATAKATAAALGIEVVPIGSLEALAFDAGASEGDIIVSALDARRGEVFWAVYRPAFSVAADPAGRPVRSDGSLVQLRAPQVGSPESLAAELAALRADLADRRAESSALRAESVARRAESSAVGAENVAGRAEPLAPTASPEPSGDILLVGDGALRHADVLAAGGAVVIGPELRFPSPAAVALVGRQRALAGGAVSPEQVDALYLRSPDAQPQPSP